MIPSFHGCCDGRDGLSGIRYGVVAVFIFVVAAGAISFTGTVQDNGIETFGSSEDVYDHIGGSDTLRVGSSVLEVTNGSVGLVLDEQGRQAYAGRDVMDSSTVDAGAASSGWEGTLGLQGDIAFVSRQTENGTDIVLLDTTPVSSVRRIGVIDGVPGTGPQQFALGDRLLVAAGNGTMHVYDIRDTRDPDLLWQREVTGTIEAIDVEGGAVSAVIESRLEDGGCPVRPLEEVTIPCSDIHHGTNATVERVSTAMTIDDGGEVRRSFAFAGPMTSHAVIGEDAFYLAYASRSSVTSLLEGFLDQLGDGGTTVMRSSMVPVHGPGHGGGRELDHRTETGDDALDATLERLNQRLDARVEGGPDTGSVDGFREWVRTEARSYLSTGLLKIDRETLSLEARQQVPGIVPRRDLLAVNGSSIVVGTHIGDLFGNGTSIDVHRLDEDLTVQESLEDIDAGRVLVDSVRVEAGRTYVRVMGVDTRTHVADLTETGLVHAGTIPIEGRAYVEPVGQDRAIRTAQAGDEIEATLFDLTGEAPVEVGRRSFGNELIWRGERPPVVSPRSFGDRFIVTGVARNYVLALNGSIQVDRLDGAAVIDAIYRGPYLYTTDRDGFRIIEDRDGLKTVSQEEYSIGTGVRRFGRGSSGLLGPGSIGDRFIRVLDIDASPAETDFGLAGDGTWHPENRTPIYRTLQDQNRTQYLVEVADSDDAVRYPEADPTDEQLEAAWSLYNRTFENARENGWFNITVGQEDGFRDLNNDRHYQKPSYATDGRVLDPERPEVLMYYHDSEVGRMVLVGVMYLTNGVYASSTEIEDGAGPLTYWHYHQYDSPVCYWEGIIPVSDMGLPWSGQQCPHLASTRSPEMLHVWFVDHPDGQFAHRMNLKTDVIAAPEKMTEERFKTKMKGNAARQ
jgi:hypothetical protein